MAYDAWTEGYLKAKQSKANKFDPNKWKLQMKWMKLISLNIYVSFMEFLVAWQSIYMKLLTEVQNAKRKVTIFYKGGFNYAEGNQIRKRRDHKRRSF